jgi:hypothetical protein
MIKFVLGIALLSATVTQAHATSIVSDAGLRILIAKQVAREAANRDMIEAIKAARDVRAAVKAAKKRK